MANGTTITPRLLDLDTLADRPTVRLNGTPYPLIIADQLPPLDQRRLTQWSARTDALLAKGELTDEEQKELEVLPRQICGVILEAPGAVLDAMTDRQRMQVIDFFVRLKREQTTAAMASLAALRSIGASGSRGSSGSTEATPSVG